MHTLFLVAAFAAKPIEKSPDWEPVSEWARSTWLDSTMEGFRFCDWRARHATEVDGTPIEEGLYVGGVCDGPGSLVLAPQWTPRLREALAPLSWWGIRADDGTVDLVSFDPDAKKKPFTVEHTPYVTAFVPAFAGARAGDVEVMLLGRDEGNGTVAMDFVDADGTVRDTVAGVLEVHGHGASVVLHLRRDGQDVHQLFDMAGKPVTPFIPGLRQDGSNWFVDVDDGLVLPVLPSGQIGRSHPSVRGYRKADTSITRYEAWISEWRLPDGTTTYGIASKDWEDRAEGRYVRVVPYDPGTLYPYLLGEDASGRWTAWMVHPDNSPANVASADSEQGIHSAIAAFQDAQAARSRASLEAFQAEQAVKARQALQAKRQAEATAVDREAAFAEVDALLAKDDLQGALDAAEALSHADYCRVAHQQRFSLTLEPAQHAMVHCYHDLDYLDWLQLDAVVQQLSRPVYSGVAAGGSSSYSSSTPGVQIDWSAQHQQLQRDQFDRSWSAYIQGSSTYDPFANGYRP